MQDLTTPQQLSPTAPRRSHRRSGSSSIIKSSARPQAQLRARKAPRVLLVEEDEDRRFALRAQLARAGFKVTVALDDVSAAWSLQYCQYDAVIANLGSSNGDVFGVLQEENERDALPSVVILTGGDEYQQTVARTMGAYVVGQTSCSLDALDRLLVG